MSYLEDFVNSVNYLPGEVTRSLELIKHLDEKAKASMDCTSNLSDEYFSSLKKEGGNSENPEVLQKVRKSFQNAMNLSEEKVVISKQMLDLVDYHISKLKQDLEAYKREIYSEAENGDDKPNKKIKIEKNMMSLDMELSMYMDNDIQDGFELQAEENKTYCYCNKGSYGEMIECEGDKCERGWFHVECVGLNSLPSGSWFCKDCTEEKKKILEKH